MLIDTSFIQNLSRLGSRNVFGTALKEIEPSRQNLKAVVADVMTSAKLTEFYEQAPQKLINVGIAEQNMIGIAAGLACEGYNVFAATFAPFASMRCFEMIRSQLGYMNLNVKVVGLLSGLTGAYFGNTHYGLEDLALLRTVPGMTVLSPADGLETYKAVIAAADINGPCYIRLTGDRGMPVIYKEDFDYKIGKANLLAEGTDIAIIGTGSILNEAVRASRGLKKNGFSVTIVDMHTIKPLDTLLLDDILSNHRMIVTIEEHTVVGGLGSAVAEYKASKKNAPPLLMLGLPDVFPKAGSPNFILNKYGLTAPQIAEKITEAYKNL